METELKEIPKLKCASCSLEDVTIPTITHSTSRRHNEAHTFQAIFSASWVPERFCVSVWVFICTFSCLFRLCVLSSPVRSRKNNHKHYMCLFLKGIILFYALLPKGLDSSRIGWSNGRVVEGHLASHPGQRPRPRLVWNGAGSTKSSTGSLVISQSFNFYFYFLFLIFGSTGSSTSLGISQSGFSRRDEIGRRKVGVDVREMLKANNIKLRP